MIVTSLRCAFCLLLASLASALVAQVPTFEEATGHALGERITLHHQMAAYLRALDVASDRVTVVAQGRSWEGRELLLAIVTSPANHARLAAIQEAARRLDDPRGLSEEDAARLLEEQPAIVWLGGSIHGFELSGSEGALKLLEDLTTHDDDATLRALDQAVVLIDPIINPDGRDAFIHWNVGRGGSAPNASRDDWNNDIDGWNALRFRTGHYFFDTNRDWFAHTQAETRARWPTIRAWRPQVIIDAHEMSSDVEFYFDPPTDPYGPFFPSFARRWFERFGEAYAGAFDGRGFEYMTGERFNYLFPGYTTSWGSYQGAVGMLYEQGSSRGLAITRPDESVRTLGDALEQHYTASRAAVDLAASRRRELLADYLAAQRAALAPADRERFYLVPTGADPGHFEALADLLVRNGIEIAVLAADVERSVRGLRGEAAAKRALPEGTVVVDTAQPRGLLARTLLDPELAIDDAFIAEARARLDRGENPRFYDITGWSLPLLFDVPAFRGTADGDLETAARSADAAVLPAAEARYAYLLDGRDARSLAAAAHLRSLGHRVSVSLVETTIEDEVVPRGSAVVRVGQNATSVHRDVPAVASRFGVAARAVGTGHGAPGSPALGSGDVVPLRGTRVALLAEAPVQAYSFGWAWYALDRQYRVPVTILRAGSLAETPLEGYDTLVIPDLGNAEALGEALAEEGVARLTRFVEDGGNLVVLANAVDFAREHLGLSLRSWYEVAKGDDEDAPEPQHVPADGVILRADLDPLSWLTAGHARTEWPFLIDSDRVYLPPDAAPDPSRRVVAGFGEQDLRLSGHLWPESHERLAGAVAVYEERKGDGRIIAFAEDPNFRGFWRGADRLFLNAVLLGPSAP